MKTSFLCLGCIARVLHNLVSASCNDEAERAVLYKQSLSLLSEDPLEESPVIVYNRILNYVLEKSGIGDPFLIQKQQRNKMAAALIPGLKQIIEKEEDQLYASLKAASSGNILDAVAVGNDGLIDEAIRQMFETGFVKDNYPIFKEKLKNAESIFYIGDNSGEIVFDGILVKHLKDMGKRIIFCVRGKPAMDDALISDFYEAGLDKYCECVDTGGGYLGFIPELIPAKTRKLFETADLVIVKGMGNFEALHELPDSRMFFAFKAKCGFIAQIAGVKTGDFCFLQGGNI